MAEFVDDEDDGQGGLCKNICNATWTVRVCDDPPPLCIPWNAMHAIATVIFIIGAIVFGLAGLSPRLQLEPSRGYGLLKTALCVSTVVCLAGFAITLSYTTAPSAGTYRRQIGVLFGVAMCLVAAWACGLGLLRRAGRRVRLKSGYERLDVGGYAEL